MARTGQGPGDADEIASASLMENDPEDLYENAPCGYLSTLPDGRIVKANQTLLDWLKRSREEVVGMMRLPDLLTVGGKLYHETHLTPLLHLQGEVHGVVLQLAASDGSRMPVLVTSTLKRDADGGPLLIRTTLADGRDRRAYENELLHSRQKAEDERERFRRMVSTLQQTLVPPALSSPPGLDVSAHYHIASPEELGGDFYDLFQLSADRWGMFLGDVSGKGASAAALTSLARYSLRATAFSDPDPVSVLKNLNTVLNTGEFDQDPRFCTVLFGSLMARPSGGYTVTLASGGHPYALLLRADGTAEYLSTPGGQLIGVLTDPDIATTTVHLTRGDTLLLYTDGLTEAHTATSSGQRYGEDALLAYADVLAPTTPDTLIDAVAELLDGFGEGLDDDTAVMALGVPSRTAQGDGSSIASAVTPTS